MLHQSSRAKSPSPQLLRLRATSRTVRGMLSCGIAKCGCRSQWESPRLFVGVHGCNVGVVREATRLAVAWPSR
jgi:hypothetical protein